MRKSFIFLFYLVTLTIVACDHEDVYEDIRKENVDSCNCFSQNDSVYNDTISNGSNQDYHIYKPYKGCRVSLMGNSRCTYRGYIPPVNRTYYPRYDINNVKLTWWWKVIEIMEANLEVNESYSAGRVSNRHPSYPSYIDRVGNLGHPDVIFFWGGINDQRNKTPLGVLDFEKSIDDLDESCFASALDKLIRLMMKLYPKAKVIIFIEDALNDKGYIGVLKNVANHYNLRTVDLTDLETTRCEGLHYDIHGMQQIVDETVKQLGL